MKYYYYDHEHHHSHRPLTNSSFLDGYQGDTRQSRDCRGQDDQIRARATSLSNQNLPFSSLSSSSSSYSDDDHEEFLEKGQIILGSTERRVRVVGRKLNLPHEFPLIEGNCQFVKKVIDDPTIVGGSEFSNEKPTYFTSLELDSAKCAVKPITEDHPIGLDPRINHQPAIIPTSFVKVLFSWDQNSWPDSAPPSSGTILVAGLPSQVTSKAYLLRILRVGIGSTLVEEIQDIHLAAPYALIVLKKHDSTLEKGVNPTVMVNILRALRKMAIIGDRHVVASFDPDGCQFRALTSSNWQSERISTINETLPILAKNASKPNYLSCSKRIPCLLVNYSVVSRHERRSTLESIFRKCRIHNIERSPTAWHVHLQSRHEVDFVKRWRKEFQWKERPVSFTLYLFEDAPLSLDTGDKSTSSSEEETNSDSDSNLNLNLGLDQSWRSNNSQKQYPLLTSVSQAPETDRPSLHDIDDLLFRSTKLATTIEKSNDAFIQNKEPLNLSIFNRRYLEREKAKVKEKSSTNDKVQATPNQGSYEAISQKEPLQQDEITVSRPDLPTVIKDKDSQPTTIFEQVTGSARTEGYYLQASNKKIVYLENIIDEYRPFTMAPSTANPVKGQRSNRASNRRWPSTWESWNGEIRASALAARHKKLVLGRSSIHSWGLFAAEDIEAGDLVIEYVGEIIRYSVANVRERRYELQLQAKGSNEMASSYFFRLDNDLVVDATQKGNLSRFINHCCDPTCIARIMIIEGSKRIIFYARQDIRQGEEITYDYKFPREDDPTKKIKCLCGSRNCRRFLN